MLTDPVVQELRWRGTAERGMPAQQVGRHRQALLRVRPGLEAPLVLRTNSIFAHQPFNAFLAGWKTSAWNFLGHYQDVIGALELGMDGADQQKHLCIGQSPALRRATPFPSLVAAEAHDPCRAHPWQRIGFPLSVNLGALHSASFAKYAVAFFGISHSILSRAFSTRKRDSSVCSGVKTLAQGTFGLPCAAHWLRERDYSLSGVAPRCFAGDSNGLLLQKMLHTPSFGAIKLYRERAYQLLTLVKSDWREVNG